MSPGATLLCSPWLGNVDEPWSCPALLPVAVSALPHRVSPWQVKQNPLVKLLLFALPRWVFLGLAEALAQL